VKNVGDRDDLIYVCEGILGVKMVTGRFLLYVLLLVVLLAMPCTSMAQKADVQLVKTPAILIGTISSTSSLVRLDKLGGSVRTLPNGQQVPELPRQSEYLVGTVYQVQINEIIKGNKMVRSGRTITILIPGPTNVSDRVVLSLQHKYLLKLSLLNEDMEKYKGTALMDLAHPSAVKRQFDSRDVFTVTAEIYNAVPITKENKELIERIRREARTR
jgi:hypothetical protein